MISLSLNQNRQSVFECKGVLTFAEQQRLMTFDSKRGHEPDWLISKMQPFANVDELQSFSSSQPKIRSENDTFPHSHKAKSLNPPNET